MLRNLRTVNQWYRTLNEDQVPLLQNSFGEATDIGGQYSQIYFFSDIYIPIPDKNKAHYTDQQLAAKGLDGEGFYINEDTGQYQYTYKNVGLSPSEMADAYMTLYGYNKLSVPFHDPDMLTLKMKSIFKLNYGKYLKLLQTLGYAYNPLWNVDGTDSFQYIDSHGNVTRTNTPILQSSQELQTVPYDNSTSYKNTNKTINTYSGTQSTETETHADILPENDNTINGPVHAITGGDYSHIEKRIRQGNQGITMTTQLIEAERECVKFNLVMEFFRDINRQLLVGTYDGF